MHEYHYIRYHFVRRSDCTYIIYHGPVPKPQPTLADRHMWSPPAAQGKPHDLTLGEYEEHDDGLDADADNDDNSHS